MDVSESKYRQQLVQAESFRKEKEAEVMDYQSHAEALEQITNARAEQLLAEAQAITECGQNDDKALDVGLWAVQERGDARYSKLMAEAQSISDSQEALALQIDAQIDSAGKYLDAELAKIEISTESAQRIAKADYQQATTQATVLQQKTDAQISRTNAQFTMEHSILQAQIERDKDLAYNQTLRGKAACERMIADARMIKIRENANIDAKNTTAQAEMDIILAANTAKRDSAQAYLNAVKARFNARIQQVKAERQVDRADELNILAIRRTDLATALAKATAAREDSTRRLAELKKRQAELQTASLANWSNKLAMFKNVSTQPNAIQIDTTPSQLAATPVIETAVVTYIGDDEEF